MKYDFENKFPLWHTHQGRIPKTNQIVIGDEIINVYPDNATNGDVLEIMFSKVNFYVGDWWDEPYQKGGKE